MAKLTKKEEVTKYILELSPLEAGILAALTGRHVLGSQANEVDIATSNLYNALASVEHNDIYNSIKFEYGGIKFVTK